MNEPLPSASGDTTRERGHKVGPHAPLPGEPGDTIAAPSNEDDGPIGDGLCYTFHVGDSWKTCPDCVRNSKLAAPSTEPEKEMRGTFTCPYCLEDSPHHHTPEELEELRSAKSRRESWLKMPGEVNNDIEFPSQPWRRPICAKHLKPDCEVCHSAAPISESETRSRTQIKVDTVLAGGTLDDAEKAIRESDTPPPKDSIEKMLVDVDAILSSSESIARRELEAHNAAILDSFSRLTRERDEARAREREEFRLGTAVERGTHEAVEAALRAELSELRSDYDEACVSIRVLEQNVRDARDELDDWREREAKCCPEDVGFEEHIAVLQKWWCEARRDATKAESELASMKETTLTPEEAAHLLSELPDLTHHIADPFITKLRATLDKLRSLAASPTENKND